MIVGTNMCVMIIVIKLMTTTSCLTSDLQHYLHHHHQPSLVMMMPGLTEEECQRYQELLEIKCQYERHSENQRREAAKNDNKTEETGQEESNEPEKGREEEAPFDSSVVDVNCNATVSEHEMALIEEELRHLEFKCRNILRAQKMQQLRERCLKAWMMEEETVAAGVGRAGATEQGNHGNN